MKTNPIKVIITFFKFLVNHLHPALTIFVIISYKKRASVDKVNKGLFYFT